MITREYNVRYGYTVNNMPQPIRELKFKSIWNERSRVMDLAFNHVSVELSKERQKYITGFEIQAVELIDEVRL